MITNEATNNFSTKQFEGGKSMEKTKISLSQLQRIDYEKNSSLKDRYIDQMLSDNGSYTHYYKCPCGEGRVVDDKDATPGFRCHDIYIECDKCRDKYEIG